ncbi:MAG: hypothetical protein ACOZDD_13905 [Bacteroidota bacterium]
MKSVVGATLAVALLCGRPVTTNKSESRGNGGDGNPGMITHIPYK